jgi:hypothetical protein
MKVALARKTVVYGWPSAPRGDRPFDPKDWHPGTPAAAELALEKGVPLGELNLSQYEQDYLLVGLPRWPEAERLAAADRLVGWLAPGWGDPDDHRSALFLAVGATKQPTVRMPKPWRGRPRRVEAWTPWEWGWELALGLMLPIEFEKAFATDDPAADESLDGVAWSDGEGEGLSFHEILRNPYARDPAVVVEATWLLDRLSARDRAWLFLLHTGLARRNVTEFARIVGCSTAKAQSAIRRARDRFVRIYEEEQERGGLIAAYDTLEDAQGFRPGRPPTHGRTIVLRNTDPDSLRGVSAVPMNRVLSRRERAEIRLEVKKIARGDQIWPPEKRK